ncbi:MULTISPECIES: hypothetical protein [Bacillaceae]|jgi:hypothetical protein|uniref:hypothetical protein n=1 Tax=Bacillaceae TaxID=186817 RepID=UPI0005A99946|nr:MULTISPECIES: hypothetical protein [Bacillaceae]MCI1592656.1 hypothetical protein [Heyndrickxia oleronia]MCI1614423.1 hypothetical protein [Heyndrickxia oleronia]MCI1745466.1 hypothetical protein [Heyndrickxia oleronia]MCI1763789.1 hypothetical protein [Heyndrickxia oleronia]
MNRERITISFLTEDDDIIEHLQKTKTERTISSYIRHLIRQDMNDNPPINNLDQLADKIASKIANSNLSLPSKQEKPSEMSVSLEDKSLINQLF